MLLEAETKLERKQYTYQNKTAEKIEIDQKQQ